jgi:hypothetical protein
MKKTLLGAWPMLVTIIAIRMNFNSSLQGSPAVLKDAIVTISFLIIWAIFLVYAVKRRELSLIFASTVFWALSLITALVTLMVNIFDLTIDIIIPFAIVFLTPLYGMGIFGVSTIFSLIIMMLLSMLYSAYCAYGFFHSRKKREGRSVN